MKLLLLSMLSTSALACPDLSKEQLNVIQEAYQQGKHQGNGLVLATLAFQESSAGMFLINHKTSDYGIYQGNYKTICVQAGVMHSTALCSLEIDKVVKDPVLAAQHALMTLDWWSNYYRGKQLSSTYQLTIRSYNAGFNPNSKQADMYWKKYQDNFSIINKCIKFEGQYV